MRINLFLFLIVISLGVSACQTTGNSNYGKWKEISHQVSNITVISDTFRVGKISLKEELIQSIENVQLHLGTERVGLMNLATIGFGSGFCGWNQGLVDNVLKTDGYLKKYIDKTGSPKDVKVKSFKNKHGVGYYVDLRGQGGRCIVTAQVLGRVSNAACSGGGSNYLTATICVKSYEDNANLDSQVLALHNTTRLEGDGKELIKKASSSATSQQTPITSSTPKVQSTITKSPGSGTVEDRLAKLKTLLSQGLLTPDEAAAKRKEILQGL